MNKVKRLKACENVDWVPVLYVIYYKLLLQDYTPGSQTSDNGASKDQGLWEPEYLGALWQCG